MKITIVYDNTTSQDCFQPDWGFSCLLEIENSPKILFDTGADGSILISNMKKLNIDFSAIDIVFISHNHYDHVGGLSNFLNINSNVKVYVPASLRGVRRADEIISVSDPVKISENIFSTGELANIEQSLLVKKDMGTIIITGCSHPDMKEILNVSTQFGKPYAIIGGLHGFNKFELFKDLKLICPAHCTEHKAKIKSLYPGKYIQGGIGKTIIL